MDEKLKALLARTNLDELAPTTSQTLDYNQPVATAAASKPVEMRSTTDPLQVRFAGADMIDKLQEPRVGGKLRLFALVFLAGPFIAAGLMLLNVSWFDPVNGGLRPLASATAWLRSGLGTAVSAAFIGVPAWLVLRRKPAGG